VFFAAPSYAETDKINASNNAEMHNNWGVNYLEEGDYFAAIKEFKIAIALNPSKQTTAVYFNNLGQTYMELSKIQKKHKLSTENGDFAHWAEISFDTAIEQDCMNMNYYKSLVQSYKAQGKLSEKLKEYKAKTEKDPFAQIVVVLIYKEQGKKRNAQISLDEFISKYPDLLITQSLKMYAKELDD
jgi:tetratricopeptide (TPR) repeat protein